MRIGRLTLMEGRIPTRSVLRRGSLALLFAVVAIAAPGAGASGAAPGPPVPMR